MAVETGTNADMSLWQYLTKKPELKVAGFGVVTTEQNLPDGSKMRVAELGVRAVTLSNGLNALHRACDATVQDPKPADEKVHNWIMQAGVFQR